MTDDDIIIAMRNREKRGEYSGRVQCFWASVFVLAIVALFRWPSPYTFLGVFVAYVIANGVTPPSPYEDLL